LSDYKMLTAAIESLPFRKYEAFQFGSANAAEVLKNGWRLSGFPPVRLDAPIEWEDADPSRRSLVFHLHSWDMVDALLKDHSISGSDLHLEAALRIADDWVARYPAFEANSAAWYDMAVGMRAYRLAYMVDAAARLKRVDPARGAPWLNSLEAHRAVLARDDFFAGHNNHGFYQLCGQLAMGRRFERLMSMMSDAVDQAESRLRDMLRRQFTTEGIHKEHSPDYQRMLMESMRALHETGLVGNPEFLTLYQKVEESLAWFILPNGKLVNFGDSDSRQMQRGKTDAERYINPVLRYVKSQGETGAPPRDWVRGFQESGYFIARNSWSGKGEKPENAFYLAQNLAFHSRTHKHADHLTFVWYDRGTEILIDAGRYGYIGKTKPKSALWMDGFWYSDPKRVYVESSAAHNTIVIDGLNHTRREAAPFGSALKNWGALKGGKICYSVGEVKHGGTIRHLRTLIAHPGSWLLVLDWVHDNHDATHEVKQWFHFAPDLVVRQEGGQLGISKMEAESDFRVQCANFSGDARISDLHCGHDEGGVLHGWWSPHEGVLSPAAATAFSSSGQTATHLTLFSLSKSLVLDREESSWNKILTKGKLRWQTERASFKLAFERSRDGVLTITHSEAGHKQAVGK
jgi:hypothetical protein